MITVAGCRNALVNVEARPLDAASFTRRCVVARLVEFSIDKYKDMMAQNAGGVLILLPTSLASLSQEEREVISPVKLLYFAAV